MSGTQATSSFLSKLAHALSSTSESYDDLNSSSMMLTTLFGFNLMNLSNLWGSVLDEAAHKTMEDYWEAISDGKSPEEISNIYNADQTQYKMESTKATAAMEESRGLVNQGQSSVGGNIKMAASTTALTKTVSSITISLGNFLSSGAYGLNRG